MSMTSVSITPGQMNSCQHNHRCRDAHAQRTLGNVAQDNRTSLIPVNIKTMTTPTTHPDEFDSP